MNIQQEQMTYLGCDLGANYTEEQTVFKLWAPKASRVTLCLYSDGYEGKQLSEFWMVTSQDGAWQKQVKGDLHGVYYTYKVAYGEVIHEVIDPYAKACGANGIRGMIVDLNKTNPQGWKEDTYVKLEEKTDAIIYELHTRDFSIHPDSGINSRGKYLAFTEENTTNSNGDLTGLAHIKELGVTHIQLLPVYDFDTVDETKEKSEYNWGYDPQNYNIPEGSYSTNPYNGETRIKEFKQMIKAIHKQGLGIIMDVVYNHTSKSVDSTFNYIMPNYYHRVHLDGTFSNGSACGNEVASEREMVSKFIIESVIYWAKEYHIDGFRFDLMGILDINTMNTIREQLYKINPNVLVYGEGWTGGDIMLPEEEAALKKNMPKLHEHIGAFSDDMRDAIKGHVFYEKEKGYVNGGKNFADSIKFGIVAATQHPQINYSNVNYSKRWWAKEPSQTITYCNAHDNLTIFDKLQMTCPDKSIEEIITMNKMAATLVLTSQGLSFLHAGEEILRSKVKQDGSFDNNSFKSPDKVNAINWENKTINKSVFEYYKGLVTLRNRYSSFRMPTTEDIKRYINFLPTDDENVVAYTIGKYERNAPFLIIYNPNDKATTLELPQGEWRVIVNKDKVDLENQVPIETSTITVSGMNWAVIIGR